jgi:hypothetical protein
MSFEERMSAQEWMLAEGWMLAQEWMLAEGWMLVEESKSVVPRLLRALARLSQSKPQEQT